jgi:hypothetical protein
LNQEILNCSVRTLPNGDGARKQLSSLWSQLEQSSASIVAACSDLEQTTAFQWFQGRRHSGSIHREQ